MHISIKTDILILLDAAGQNQGQSNKMNHSSFSHSVSASKATRVRICVIEAPSYKKHTHTQSRTIREQQILLTLTFDSSLCFIHTNHHHVSPSLGPVRVGRNPGHGSSIVRGCRRRTGYVLNKPKGAGGGVGEGGLSLPFTANHSFAGSDRKVGGELTTKTDNGECKQHILICLLGGKLF